MLIELSCDKFKGGSAHSISFVPGLNIVLGTKGATNSIGKSTSLMILDFVFGGDDYLRLSKDVKAHIGDHSFRFAFRFGDKTYRYIRGTEKPNEVLVCDEFYEPISTMPLNNYREVLSRAYGLSDIGISWREMVSGTFRIWQRDNDKPTLPLSTHRTDTHRSGITRLLALFGKLGPVKEALENEEQAKAAVEAAKISPSIYKLSISSNKEEYEANEKRIVELQKQLERVTASFGQEDESVLTEEQAKTVAELKRVQTPLYRQRTILMNQLEALDVNSGLGGARRTKADFEQLQEFVPELDVNYLDKVEGFHATIKKLLSKQVKDEIKKAEEKLQTVKSQLARLDEQITRITTAPTITAGSAQAYHELKTEIAMLRSANQNYRIKEENREMLSKVRDSIDKDAKELLVEIEKEINAYLKRVDGSFTNEKRNPPKLQLKKIDSYSYAIADDTGTGSGYRSLLSFDLALLEHSKLPVIIEDSFLFKQIETEAVERILDHYTSVQDKQIFIALDEIGKYSEETQEIIRNHTRLQLDSGSGALFGKEWGKK